MKSELITITFLLFSFEMVWGQSVSDQVFELKPPSSPGAIVLGIQPSSFLYPKTPKALETTLLSNFLDDKNNIAVPDNFGVEFSPYWFNDHGLSVDDYLFSSNFKEYIEQAWRNSSFSIATTQNFLLEDSSKTNAFGLGYRTTLFFSSKNDKGDISDFQFNIRALKKMSTRIQAKAEGFDTVSTKEEFISKITPHIIQIISDGHGEDNMQLAYTMAVSILEATQELSFDNNDVDSFLDSFNSLISDSLKDIESQLTADSLVSNFKNYLTNREGFSIDLGYAVLLNFPSNTFKTTYSSKKILWINPGFRFKNEQWKFLKIMGVYRNTSYDLNFYEQFFPTQEIFEKNVDLGGAISGDFEKMTLHFEFLKRKSDTQIPGETNESGSSSYSGKKRTDFQSIGSISYQLKNDIVLTYSLGERFDEVLSNNNIVSLLTVNFGFGGLSKN